MTEKKKRKPRIASSKNGYKTMSQIYGDAYGEANKFKTYQEVTEEYENITGEKISINTACNWYHKGMFKMASEILEHHAPGKYSDMEKKKISRSAEFQTYLRDMLSDIYYADRVGRTEFDDD